MALSAAFSRALSANRKAFNGQVGAVRLRAPGLDMGQFTAFLTEYGDPLIIALARQNPDCVPRCASEIFTMALDLAAHGALGTDSRGLAVRRAWGDIAPAMLGLLESTCTQTLGLVTNSAIKLCALDGVRVDTWVDNMSDLLPKATDNKTLRALVTMCAWRAGASHFRQNALAAGDFLPPDLACAAVGSHGDNWQGLVSRYKANDWWQPESGLRQSEKGYLFGRFSGYGGRFNRPPSVRACAQGFFVMSGEAAFLMIADAYGATLHGASVEEFEAASANFGADNVALIGNQIAIGERRVSLDWPADGLGLAYNQHTIAVTSPYSYAIRLLPRVVL